MKQKNELIPLDLNIPQWISKYLEDPISYDIFVNPYITLSSGYSYSYSMFSELNTMFCPVTNITFNKEDLVHDKTLTQLLDYYQKSNTNGLTIPWHLFSCPLTNTLFIDPVIAVNGVTYERSALEEYLHTHDSKFPNSDLSHNGRLITHRVLKNLIESNDFKKERQNNNNWQSALSILRDEPNGSKLPYSAVWDEKTNSLTTREKQSYLFDYKRYETTHSFIKIDDNIYRLALSKNPDAIVGQGTFGKIKYIEDQHGKVFVAKIEVSNTNYQQCEYKILKDLQLSNGKSKRRDKAKFYTHMHNLGLPLHLLLLHHDLKICPTRPSNAEIQENTAYLYLNKDQIEYVFQDWQRKAQDKKLDRKDLGENYEILLNEINSISSNLVSMHPSETNFPYILFEQRPNNSEIQKNTLSLYAFNNEFWFAFRDNLGDVKRHLVNKNAFSEKPNDRFLCKISEHRPNDDIQQNTFYIYLNNGSLRCLFKNNNKINRLMLKEEELFYSQIQKELEYQKNNLRMQPISDERLKTSIYKATNLNPKPPEKDKRLDIAIDICLKLAELHEGRNSTTGTAYAHLDLKTDNIVIDEKSNVHLIDFGVSEPYINMIRDHHSTAIHGTPIYMPYYNMYFHGLTREQYDIVALKRVLFMPLHFYSKEGYTRTDFRFQKERSVLTQNILDELQLASYVSTFSTHIERNDFARDKMTARALAAILIAARLNLDIRYNSIKNDADLSKKITSIYAEHKNNLLLKQEIEYELHEEISQFRSPQLLAQQIAADELMSRLLQAQQIIVQPINIEQHFEPVLQNNNPNESITFLFQCGAFIEEHKDLIKIICVAIFLTLLFLVAAMTCGLGLAGLFGVGFATAIGITATTIAPTCIGVGGGVAVIEMTGLAAYGIFSSKNSCLETNKDNKEQICQDSMLNNV